MRFERLVVASKNPDKIEEVEAILGGVEIVDEIVRGLEWPDIPETAHTLEGNALLKAETVASVTELPSLADDTGLEVHALGGAPGVWTARYAGPDATYEDNVDKMLRELADHTDRRARFRTVVALIDPVSGRRWTAHGSVEGVIAHSRRGEGGFGYDPIFEVDGRTLAEMTSEEKDAISHRARAIRALVRLLT